LRSASGKLAFHNSAVAFLEFPFSGNIVSDLTCGRREFAIDFMPSQGKICVKRRQSDEMRSLIYELLPTNITLHGKPCQMYKCRQKEKHKPAKAFVFTNAQM
jgi:hypothetical protein